MTPLEQLAAWASTLAIADIPDEQLRLARLRLLDTLGLIGAASHHAAARSLIVWAAANPGTGATVLPTGGAAAAATAALVSGTLAHARDFDDTFADSVVHPGSPVNVAALAVAEARGSSFDDLLLAVIIGYEIAARVGGAAGRRFHARGFHATGLVGPIAAAAVAGRLCKLDAAAIADAMGLATSMSGGLFAFLADGAWSKWLHAGWSAHGGIIAAELAGAAFRGPRHGLDHQYGLYGAFLGPDQADLAVLTRDLGNTWLGAAAHSKVYPCAHVIHPYIAEILRLRQNGTVRADNVQAITCVLAPWAMPIVAEPRAPKIAPQNDLDAIASQPFMVAAALRDGAVNLTTLEPETLRRADILEVAARVACVADAALGAGFDGRMEIVMADGTRAIYPVAASPRSEARIIEKFRANLRRAPPGAAAALERALLEETPDARTVAQLAARAIAPCAEATP
jgi:2-methylcitrate dehydratase PrpD